MKKLLLIFVVGALALSACSKKEEAEKEGKSATACTGTPTPSPSLALPSNFPSIDGVDYTSTTTAGPSTIVAGFSAHDLDELFKDAKKAFSSGGYTVTKEEKDPHDAEVNFSGNNTTGQVRLGEDCKDRNTVTITVRPA